MKPASIIFLWKTCHGCAYIVIIRKRMNVGEGEDMSDSAAKDKINKDIQFTMLVSEYKDKIYRLTGRFFNNRLDREDVVQETFMRVYTNLSRFDSTKNVSAWIHRIGTNICIDTLRRKSTRRTAVLLPMRDQDFDLMDTLPSKEISPEDATINKELKVQIERFMDELPAKWKPFIYQHYILDMTLEELSIANDMPVSTVKSRLYRARSYLQKRYLIEIAE